MTSITAGTLIVVFVATVIFAGQKRLRLAALVGLLIVVLAVGALVALIYADPISHRG